MYTDISEQWPGDDPYTAAVLEFGVRYEQAILDWLAALPFELGVERVRRARSTATGSRGQAAGHG